MGDPQSDGGKADGAMLAIGELANRIGVPTHVLRYWETRFPELKPLQRSGRRRYYRAEDVALAMRINDLLHVQGFTVEGARKLLSGETTGERRDPLDAASLVDAPPPAAELRDAPRPAIDVAALMGLRQRLVNALA